MANSDMVSTFLNLYNFKCKFQFVNNHIQQTLEFIDLSDVDEKVKHSVLSLLRLENNPKVQLPWVCNIAVEDDNIQNDINSNGK